MMNEVTNSTLSDFYLADGTDLTARKTEQMFCMVTHKREQKDQNAKKLPDWSLKKWGWGGG